MKAPKRKIIRTLRTSPSTDLSVHWESAEKVAVVVLEMVMVVVGGWAAEPWLILSLFCVCKCCAQCRHISTFHCQSRCPCLSLSFPLIHPCRFFFSQATEAVCFSGGMPHSTRENCLNLGLRSPHLLFSPHYCLTYLTGIMVKEILFGPFQTAKLADWKHSAPVTSREFGSLLKWSF